MAHTPLLLCSHLVHPLQEKPTLVQLETLSLRSAEISDNSSKLTLQRAAAEGPGGGGEEAPSSSRGSGSQGVLGNHSPRYRALSLKAPVPEVWLSWSQISSEM